MSTPTTLALLLLAAAMAQAANLPPLDGERVKAIAAMLPDHPVGLGRPASDRAAWTERAALPRFQAVVRNATGLLGKPAQPVPEALFLEFSQNGNRTHWQDAEFPLRGRLPSLVIAECVEHQGRFIPAIEQLIGVLAAEKTWVMPAHDGDLSNHKGTRVDIDLASSALGWQLAQTAWLLGDQLSGATRQLIATQLEQRILAPYRDMLDAKRGYNWWITGDSNWNAVCTAGTVGTALAGLDSREERARFVAAAERSMQSFLKGFTDDGYCSEGVGYWDYGYGNFVLLAETLYQATGGKLDLMAVPKVKAASLFGVNIQIRPGVCPAFADCAINSRPDANILWYVNHRLGLGLADYDQLDLRGVPGDLAAMAIYEFPSAASQAPAAAAAPKAGLRSWFDQAGILIARPAEGTPTKLAVALKGGHNAELHNHNDVGSYVVVVGRQPVLLDPGSEVYSKRTFSAQRYDSKLLNSYGHAVPVVAGQLQKPGADARAKVLKSEFSDSADTLQLDLASAYPVPELTKLTRTWVYSRTGDGALTVNDEVALKEPKTFGTALITLGTLEQPAPGKLLVTTGSQAVEVSIEASGPTKISTEEIHENAPVTPLRIGVDLVEPTREGFIKLTITPHVLKDASGQPILLANGGFERGKSGWELPNDGLAEISAEQTAGGKASLKINDTRADAGTNIHSAEAEVPGGGTYELRGKIYTVSGKGIGLYVKLFDGQGRQLNPSDARGNIAPVADPSGPVGQWQPFAAKFTVPPETRTLRLWIHSYNGSTVTAYLDDLEIAPVKPGNG